MHQKEEINAPGNSGSDEDPKEKLITRYYRHASDILGSQIAEYLREGAEKVDSKIPEDLGGGKNGVFDNLVYKSGQAYNALVNDIAISLETMPDKVAEEYETLSEEEKQSIIRTTFRMLSLTLDEAEGFGNRWAKRVDREVGMEGVLEGANYKASKVVKLTTGALAKDIILTVETMPDKVEQRLSQLPEEERDGVNFKVLKKMAKLASDEGKGMVQRWTKRVDTTLGTEGFFQGLGYKSANATESIAIFLVNCFEDEAKSLPSKIRERLDQLSDEEKSSINDELIKASGRFVLDEIEGQVNKVAKRVDHLIGGEGVVQGMGYKGSKALRWGTGKAYEGAKWGYRKVDTWSRNNETISDTKNWVKEKVRGILDIF